MAYMDANAAFAGDIQELSVDEITVVNGGARVAAARSAFVKVIDWIGRAMTVKAVLDALPEVDLAEFAKREQARRPGAGG